jgi:hypothetical protein
MEADEEHTLDRSKAHRREFIDPEATPGISQHQRFTSVAGGSGTRRMSA